MQNVRRATRMMSRAPAALRQLAEGYASEVIAIGESDAEVVRLHAAGRPTLFLKRLRKNGHDSLRDEAARLRWLAATAVPTSEVLLLADDRHHEWLLMTAVPGVDAAQTGVPPDAVAAAMADGLSALHHVAVESCPFDETLARKIARAESNVAAGRVEEDDFDEHNLGRSAADLFAEMVSQRPTSEDLVVTHGDACSPNILLDGHSFAGFIDCARLGRADRYQDLALATRSIEYNFGPEWVEPFLRRYGCWPADTAKLTFYRLLDEFS